MLLHRTFKSAIPDVCAYFRTHFRSDPNLESSGQTFLLLQKQLRGYKKLEPTMKHHKAIPGKLFLHIYKRTNTNLNTAISQLIAGAFFFDMRYCEYSKTPKREEKCTHILQKRDICFNIKCLKLSHNSGVLHLDDKVSPKLCTRKNGVKNATVTQCQTAITLCPVHI